MRLLSGEDGVKRGCMMNWNQAELIVPIGTWPSTSS